MKQKLYTHIQELKVANKKSFAVLIDPDKLDDQALLATIEIAKSAQVDYFFVGEA